MYPLDRPVDVVDLLYWLGRSPGFAVDGPDGRVGTVSAVRAARGSGLPVSLVVREPLAGPPLVVPVADVAQVNARERRIFLAARSSPVHAG